MSNDNTNKRQFKGVWIPAEIWLDADLTLNEKAILTEIDSFSGEQGCFASNKHFSEFISLSPNRCSTIITDLKDKGKLTITYTYQPGTKKIAKRFLKVVNSYVRNTPSGNAKGTNTSNTNTKDKECSIPLVVIIYLNLKTGKAFKNNSFNSKLILSKISEGYNLNDFIRVIDNKIHTWKGDQMADSWLRPTTLFGMKFDEYLNDNIICTKKKTNSEAVQPEYFEDDELISLELITEYKKQLMENVTMNHVNNMEEIDFDEYEND